MLMVHPMDFRALAMQGALDASFKEIAKRKSMRLQERHRPGDPGTNRVAHW